MAETGPLAPSWHGGRFLNPRTDGTVADFAAGSSFLANSHVHGLREQGSTTAAFDLLVRNDLDRWRRAAQVAEYVSLPTGLAARVRAAMHVTILHHRGDVVEEGVDRPEANDWKWTPRR